MAPRKRDESPLVFDEFDFWKACVLKLAVLDVSAEDAALEADKLVAQYRLRAARVVNFHGHGLYTTREGVPSGLEHTSASPEDLKDGTWKPGTPWEEQGH
jgi:hypothetical protein